MKEAAPEIPWDEIRGMRILVDHIYHRIDYDVLWQTIKDDVPLLVLALRRWKEKAK